MELSNRLRAVAGLVTEGASVADIGTDHGYIPIYLTEQGIVSKVIAMDINRGPLERARMHVTGHGLKGQIELRQSDGLKALKPGEVDTIIISGMGGTLIVRILEEGKRITECLDACILQPQSEISKVRRYLVRNHMTIVEEDMVEEDGKFYPVMKVVHGDASDYTECEYIYGRCLLHTRHPVLIKYLRREKAIHESIFCQLDRHKDSESAALRKEEVRKEIILIDEAMEYYAEK